MTKLEIVLLVFGFIITLVISEAVYTYKNPDRLAIYAFEIAKSFSSAGNAKGAFFVLTKAGEIITDETYQSYPAVVKKALYKPGLPDNPKLDADISAYLNSLPQGSLRQGGNYDLSRLLYKIGLLAYADGQADLTPQLFGLAVNVNPTLSFWQIELANYYLLTGQVAMGQQVLDDCIKIAAPRQHCQDYSSTNFISGLTDKVGFLSESSDTYYARVGN